MNIQNGTMMKPINVHIEIRVEMQPNRDADCFRAAARTVEALTPLSEITTIDWCGAGPTADGFGTLAIIDAEGHS
jgi:hypothetical protein